MDHSVVGKQRLVLVTDPMCSWCWGMADEFEQARMELAPRLSFDFILGGINTHGSQLIGDYGRRFLMKLWAEVAQTTGQRFGFCLPESYIHNSALSCMACEAVRNYQDTPPFEYLRSLQERFFVYGENINHLEVLTREAVNAGVPADAFTELINSSRIEESVRFQFENAKSFGTQALPSVLIEKQNKLTLLAGGFVDANMLASLVEG